MVTEPFNTVRASADEDAEGCHCVRIEIGHYRVVGCFDADAYAEMSPEDARDLASNILAATSECERRQRRDKDEHLGVGQ